jgi:hypothetical protein
VVLNLFAATTNPVVAERMTKDCLLLPLSRSELEVVSRWTDTAIQVTSKHSAWKWIQLARALAEFRRADFAAAVNWTQQLSPSTGEDANRDVQAFAVLAMSEHQLGHTTKAALALARASETSAKRLAKPDSRDFGSAWVDWIIAQTLLREARQLIEKAQLSGKEKNEIPRP